MDYNKQTVYKASGVYKEAGGGGGGGDEPILPDLYQSVDALYRQNKEGGSNPITLNIGRNVTNEGLIIIKTYCPVIPNNQGNPMNTPGIGAARGYTNGAYVQQLLYNKKSLPPNGKQEYSLVNCTGSGSSTFNIYTSPEKGIIEYKLMGKKLAINNVVYNTNVPYGTISMPYITPFTDGQSETGISYNIGTIHIIIKDQFGNNTLYLKPCKRIADSVKGFYDFVSGNFYQTNATFIKEYNGIL
jgi:hypothetical protein